MRSTQKFAVACAMTLVLIACSAGAWSQTNPDRMTISELAKQTHFHGIAVDPQDPARIYLATHHGFFAVSPDGTATRLSTTRDDFMGFTLHPSDPGTLYASGHPAEGGNLGFVVSTDGGKTWRQISPGVGGPVDFHQMTVSPADPTTIFGAYAGALQVSRDSGKTWALVGPAPDRLIDLAASSVDVNRLYAATQAGLLQSADGGRTWTEAFALKRPATMVEVSPIGHVYAFVIGSGLIRAAEPTLSWQNLANSWGEDYLLHLAADEKDLNRLYAVTGKSGIVASSDGGKTWTSFGSAPRR